ncbi:MAG: hypothetical protein LBB23_04195 [Rickettsiales bacterium]|jgi:hypothetical protein|nr:hypothetical protein [Rickettsiales bacterium]
MENTQQINSGVNGAKPGKIALGGASVMPKFVMPKMDAITFARSDEITKEIMTKAVKMQLLLAVNSDPVCSIFNYDPSTTCVDESDYNRFINLNEAIIKTAEAPYIIELALEYDRKKEDLEAHNVPDLPYRPDMLDAYVHRNKQKTRGR